MSEWKSPRKVEEEIRDYRRNLFEILMAKVDRGEISRKMALKALRDAEEQDNGR